MTDEMKPVKCGCGGEANIYTYEAIWKKTEDGYQRSVGCLKCGISTQLYDTEAEAVKAWNRAMSGNGQEYAKDARCSERTAKVETVEKPNVYKCSECGQYFHSTAWGSPVAYCSRCGCRLEWEYE